MAKSPDIQRSFPLQIILFHAAKIRTFPDMGKYFLPNGNLFVFLQPISRVKSRSVMLVLCMGT